MTDTSTFTPSHLNRMDTQRLAAYRHNLDFYQGAHWPTTSRHRQLVFNYAKVSIDKVTSFLIQGLNFACYPNSAHLSLRGAKRRGNLVIELDNSKGQYASPGEGALASLRFRSEIVLGLGYKTAAGNETSEAGTYWIDSWEYRSVSLRGGSRSNLSTFTLYCLDG